MLNEIPIEEANPNYETISDTTGSQTLVGGNGDKVDIHGMTLATFPNDVDQGSIVGVKNFHHHS
jgi:hypothetical protein